MGSTYQGKINVFYDIGNMTKPKSNKEPVFISVDEYEPSCPEEVIVNCVPGFFIAPISVIGGLNQVADTRFNYFMLATKKCYNSPAMRQHLYQYLNTKYLHHLPLG